jgi:hypothetical protein
MLPESNARVAVAPSLLLLVFAVLTLECGGSPTITCQNATCSSGTKTYQVCSHMDDSVTYQYGGQSCACSGGNSPMCQACATMVAGYCTGVPVGGSGGTGAAGSGGTDTAGSGGSGGTGAGGSGVCAATFSGGVTGTYSPCQVSITYTATGDLWILSAAGAMIPGTSFEWTGLSMSFRGMPATGTFDQAASVGSSDQVIDPGSANPPIWEAGFAQNELFGSASLTISSLGQPTNVTGAVLYTGPHGTLTATLVDQNPQTAQPSVMMTLNF